MRNHLITRAREGMAAMATVHPNWPETVGLFAFCVIVPILALGVK